MRRFSLLVQLIVYAWLLIIILLGMVGGLYYHSSSHIIRQMTEQTTRETIGQGGAFIDSYLKKLKETTASLATNHQVRSYAQAGNTTQKDQIQQLMETILKTDSDLVGAVLVTKNGQVVSTDSRLVMQTSEDMMNQSWYQAAIHQKAMPVLLPARMEGRDQEWVVSITQEVIDDKGQNLGVLRLDLGYESLENYLDQLDLGKEGFAFIVNDQHQFVYHPKKTVYSSSQEMKAMEPYVAIADGYAGKDSKSPFVYQYKVANSGWTLVGVASLDELYTVQGQILQSFIGMGCVAFFVSGVGIWLVLRIWIRPIKDLQFTILEISKGQSHLRAREVGSPELLDLSQQFNRMLDQIDKLMLDIREKEQHVRQYELKALASQINPHFLYNTLDTIVWMAEFNDSQRVVEVTQSLAKYFRLALNQGNEEITLKDELDHVRQYLFIQKQRYGEQLSYSIEELSTFDDYLLPKLVLQPLVENAIYHGIKEVSHKGVIRITVSDTEKHVLIRIYDNGKGFSNDAVTSQNQIKRGGVGLRNVQQRLELQFGSSYHMKIESKEDTYTDIQIYLPKHR